MIAGSQGSYKATLDSTSDFQFDLQQINSPLTTSISSKHRYFLSWFYYFVCSSQNRTLNWESSINIPLKMNKIAQSQVARVCTRLQMNCRRLIGSFGCCLPVKKFSDLPGPFLESLKLTSKESQASSYSIGEAGEPWEKKHKTTMCLRVQDRPGYWVQKEYSGVGIGRWLNGGKIVPYTSSETSKLFIRVPWKRALNQTASFLITLVSSFLCDSIVSCVFLFCVAHCQYLHISCKAVCLQGLKW